MIRERDYKPDSPEWVMAKFFSCWKRRAWVQILDYVQPSWLAKQEEPRKALKMLLYRLVNAEFVQRNATTGIVAVFLVDIHREFYGVTDQTKQPVRLVREGKKWGIDPTYLAIKVFA